MTTLGTLTLELSAPTERLRVDIARSREMAKQAALEFGRIKPTWGIAASLHDELRATRSVMQSQLKQMEVELAGHRLKVGIDFDRDILTTLSHQIADVNRQKIKVSVDDTRLTELNRHLSLKEQHLDRVVEKFQNKPITPKVDEQELTKLSEILVDIDRPHKLKFDLPDTIGGLTKELRKIALSPITIPIRIAQNAIGDIFTGIFEGIGRRISKDFAKGFYSSIDSFIQRKTGTSSIEFGEKSGKYIAKNTYLWGEYLSRAQGYEKGLNGVAEDLSKIGDAVDSVVNPRRFRRNIRKAEDTLVTYLEKRNEGDDEGANAVVTEAAKPFIDGFTDIAKRAGGVGLRIAAQPYRIRKRARLKQSIAEAEQLAKDLEIPNYDQEQAESAESINLVMGGIDFNGTRNTAFASRLMGQVMPKGYTIPLRTPWSNTPVGRGGMWGDFVNNPNIQALLSNLLGEQAVDGLDGINGLDKMPVSKLLQIAIDKGYNPDAISGYAYIKKLRELHPDKPINVIGTSGGSAVAEEIISLAERDGDRNIRGLGVGLPFHGLTATAGKQFKGTIGDLDNLMIASYGTQYTQRQLTPEQLKKIPFTASGLLAPDRSRAAIIPNAGVDHNIGMFSVNAGFQSVAGSHLNTFINPDLSGRQGIVNLKPYVQFGHQDQDLNIPRTLKAMFGDKQAHQDIESGEYSYYVPSHPDWRRDNDFGMMKSETAATFKSVKGLPKEHANEYISFLDLMKSELTDFYESDRSALPFNTLQKAAEYYPELRPLAARELHKKSAPVDDYPQIDNAYDSLNYPEINRLRSIHGLKEFDFSGAIDIPEWAKNATNGQLQIYSNFLSKVSSPNLIPNPNDIQKVGRGYSGTAAFLTDNFAYKTDLKSDNRMAQKMELDVYNQLQGRYSPLLYHAEPGKLLITERIKGQTAREKIRRFAEPVYKSQNTIRDLEASINDAKQQGTDTTELEQKLQRAQKIFENRKKWFNQRAAFVYEQMGRVGASLQEMGVTHGDLHPENVMFSESGSPRAIDFGSSIVNPNKKQKQDDINTAVLRINQDSTHSNIIDRKMMVAAIKKGYKNPLPSEEKRIANSDLLPKFDENRPRNASILSANADYIATNNAQSHPTFGYKNAFQYREQIKKQAQENPPANDIDPNQDPWGDNADTVQKQPEDPFVKAAKNLKRKNQLRKITTWNNRPEQIINPFEVVQSDNLSTTTPPSSNLLEFTDRFESAVIRFESAIDKLNDYIDGEIEIPNAKVPDDKPGALAPSTPPTRKELAQQWVKNQTEQWIIDPAQKASYQLSQQVGATYQSLKKLEQSAFNSGLMPGASLAKSAITNIAFPVAAFGAAGHLPVLGGAVGGAESLLTSAMGGLMHVPIGELANMSTAAITSILTQSIGNIPGIGHTLAPQLAHAIAEAISSGAAGMSSTLAEILTPILGGKLLLGTGKQITIKALPGLVDAGNMQLSAGIDRQAMKALGDGRDILSMFGVEYTPPLGFLDAAKEMISNPGESIRKSMGKDEYADAIDVEWSPVTEQKALPPSKGGLVRRKQTDVEKAMQSAEKSFNQSIAEVKAVIKQPHELRKRAGELSEKFNQARAGIAQLLQDNTDPNRIEKAAALGQVIHDMSNKAANEIAALNSEIKEILKDKTLSKRERQMYVNAQKTLSAAQGNIRKKPKLVDDLFSQNITEADIRKEFTGRAELPQMLGNGVSFSTIAKALFRFNNNDAGYFRPSAILSKLWEIGQTEIKPLGFLDTPLSDFWRKSTSNNKIKSSKIKESESNKPELPQLDNITQKKPVSDSEKLTRLEEQRDKLKKDIEITDKLLQDLSKDSDEYYNLTAEYHRKYRKYISTQDKISLLKDKILSISDPWKLDNKPTLSPSKLNNWQSMPTKYPEMLDPWAVDNYAGFEQGLVKVKRKNINAKNQDLTLPEEKKQKRPVTYSEKLAKLEEQRDKLQKENQSIDEALLDLEYKSPEYNELDKLSDKKYRQYLAVEKRIKDLQAKTSPVSDPWELDNKPPLPPSKLTNWQSMPTKYPEMLDPWAVDDYAGFEQGLVKVSRKNINPVVKKGVDNDSQVGEKISPITKVLNTLGSAVRSVAGELIRLGGAAIAVTVITSIGQAALETASNFEQLQLKMQSSTGSLQTGLSKFNALRSEASKIGVSQSLALSAGSGFAATTLGGDLEGRPTDRITKDFLTLTQRMGMNQATAKSAEIALKQILGKPRVSAEELNQLVESGGITNARAIGARSMGMSLGQFTKALESGSGINSQKFVQGFLAQANADSLLISEQSLNTQQAKLTKLQSSVENFQLMIGQRLDPAFKAGLDLISGAINLLRIGMELTSKTLIGFAATLLPKAVSGLMALYKAFHASAIAQSIWGMSLNTAIGVFNGLLTKFVAFYAAGEAISYFVNKMRDSAEETNKQTESIGKLINEYDRLNKVKPEPPPLPKKASDIWSDKQGFEGFVDNAKIGLDRFVVQPLFGFWGTDKNGKLKRGLDPKEKEANDRANAMDKIKAQMDDRTSRIERGITEASKGELIDIDRQIARLNSQRAALGITGQSSQSLQTQVRDLMSRRDEITGKRSQESAIAESSVKQLEGELQKLDELKEKGQITQDDYDKSSKFYKEQLDNAKALQLQLRLAIKSPMDDLASWGNALDSITAKFEGIRAEIQAANAQLRISRNLSESQGKLTKGSAEYQASLDNQQSIINQIDATNKVIDELQTALNAKDPSAVDTVRQSYQITEDTSVAEITAKANATSSDYDKQILTKLANLKEQQFNVGELQAQLSDARTEMYRRIQQETRDAARFYIDLARQVDPQEQGFNKAIAEISTNRNRVLAKLKGYGNSLADGWINALLDLFDTSKKQLERQAEAYRKHRDAINRYQDNQMQIDNLNRNSFQGNKSAPMTDITTAIASQISSGGSTQSTGAITGQADTTTNPKIDNRLYQNTSGQVILNQQSSIQDFLKAAQRQNEINLQNTLQRNQSESSLSLEEENLKQEMDARKAQMEAKRVQQERNRQKRQDDRRMQNLAPAVTLQEKQSRERLDFENNVQDNVIEFNNNLQNRTDEVANLIYLRNELSKFKNPSEAQKRELDRLNQTLPGLISQLESMRKLKTQIPEKLKQARLQIEKSQAYDREVAAEQLKLNELTASGQSKDNQLTSLRQQQQSRPLNEGLARSIRQLDKEKAFNDIEIERITQERKLKDDLRTGAIANRVGGDSSKVSAYYKKRLAEIQSSANRKRKTAQERQAQESMNFAITLDEFQLQSTRSQASETMTAAQGELRGIQIKAKEQVPFTSNAELVKQRDIALIEATNSFNDKQDNLKKRLRQITGSNEDLSVQFEKFGDDNLVKNIATEYNQIQRNFARAKDNIYTEFGVNNRQFERDRERSQFGRQEEIYSTYQDIYRSQAESDRLRGVDTRQSDMFVAYYDKQAEYRGKIFDLQQQKDAIKDTGAEAEKEKAKIQELIDRFQQLEAIDLSNIKTQFSELTGVLNDTQQATKSVFSDFLFNRNNGGFDWRKLLRTPFESITNNALNKVVPNLFGWMYPQQDASRPGSNPLGFFGQLLGFKDGGVIGSGRGKADDQLILAQRGEGIVTHKGMDILGASGLQALNLGLPPLPKFEFGGVVGGSNPASVNLSQARIDAMGTTNSVSINIDGGTSGQGIDKRMVEGLRHVVTQELLRHKRSGTGLS